MGTSEKMMGGGGGFKGSLVVKKETFPSLSRIPLVADPSFSIVPFDRESETG